MKLAHLTAGTGNFHCGNCHRDNTLVRELRRQGHDAFLVPLYLPLVLDEPAASPDAPLFAGGINMFLQQKVPFFRRTPRWLDSLLDSTGLLRLVSKFAGMTRAKDLGEMTVETFKGVHSAQEKEWDRLLVWLEPQRPDVVAISNGLLCGLARGLKERLGCRVVCSLQGEDSFLDGLPEPYRAQAWQAFREAGAAVDRFVGVSEYYSALMRERLGFGPEKIVTVHNGIDLAEFGPSLEPPSRPTVGYLARLCHGKGLHTLVEAFILLKRRGNIPELQLRVAGAKTSIDEAYVAEQEKKLAEAGCAADATFQANLEAEAKKTFLHGLSVLSVPANYGESFGLYVIEALACGVPVVLPEHAAFPELVHATTGGVLCAPDDPAALAVALEQFLLTPGLTAEVGRRGLERVRTHFSAESMARNFAAVCEPARA